MKASNAEGHRVCASVMASKQTYYAAQNADLARLQQVSQVLFKKGENFVKGDREIVSGCTSEGE